MAIQFGYFSIVPLLATVLAVVRFLVPLREVVIVRKERRLGELNPVPYATAILNTSGWIVYSVLTQNLLLFAGEALGLLCSIWITFSLYPHTSPKEQDHLNVFVTSAGCLWSSLALATLILQAEGAVSDDSIAHLWGFAVSATQVLLMGSPLSTLLKAIRQRCSASFHFGLNFLGFTSSVMWTVYSSVKWDLFILVPSALGSVLSLASLTVLMVLPRQVKLPAPYLFS